MSTNKTSSGRIIIRNRQDGVGMVYGSSVYNDGCLDTIGRAEETFLSSPSC